MATGGPLLRLALLVLAGLALVPAACWRWLSGWPGRLTPECPALSPAPGAKLQMLDLPGIIEGAKDGKGRGRQASGRLPL